MNTPRKKKDLNSENIGLLPIDPNAEPVPSQPSAVSGQQETDFFKKAGTEFQLLHNQQNLGMLGKFFSANSSASTNIAGFVIICSFLILAASFLCSSNADLVESRKWLIGLITSAMSFIFGAASKK
ncbi:MAG: hypothetical protein V4495_26830 [Pseudomonadota bacterium]